MLWSSHKISNYVIDRAFIEARYWDQRKKEFNATVITRVKTIFKYQVLEEFNRATDPVIEGVLSDQLIQLSRYLTLV